MSHRADLTTDPANHTVATPTVLLEPLVVAPRPTGPPRGRRTVKRTVDVVIGLPLAIVATPFIVAICIVSAVWFRAWPIFTQRRGGRWGESIRVLKVRSLPTSTPTDADKHELVDLPSTAFGRVIRGTHLDELPQLWQVVTGSMSLVGPRPEMPRLEAAFSASQRDARAPFRPGCFGLWQLSPDVAGLMSEAPEYDLFYAEHQSFKLDLYVLWRAARHFLGAPRLQLTDVPRWARRGDGVRAL